MEWDGYKMYLRALLTAVGMVLGYDAIKTVCKTVVISSTLKACKTVADLEEVAGVSLTEENDDK